MSTVHSTIPSKIHAYALSAGELLAIGRVVRACAEIDEIANLYLRKLASIKDWQAIILLGRMPTSARLRLAASFAETQGPATVALHKECFDSPEYHSLIKFRNTVVHGLLLGKTDEGSIAFEVQETAGLGEDRIFSTVNAFAPEAFDGLAGVAERAIPQLEERLKLRSLREKHRLQDLAPHPKAHRTATKVAKRERLPRSSSE